MKKLILLLVLSVGLIGCKQSDDPQEPEEQEPDVTKSVIPSSADLPDTSWTYTEAYEQTENGIYLSVWRIQFNSETEMELTKTESLIKGPTIEGNNELISMEKNAETYLYDSLSNELRLYIGEEQLYAHFSDLENLLMTSDKEGDYLNFLKWGDLDF